VARVTTNIRRIRPWKDSPKVSTSLIARRIPKAAPIVSRGPFLLLTCPDPQEGSRSGAVERTRTLRTTRISQPPCRVRVFTGYCVQFSLGGGHLDGESVAPTSNPVPLFLLFRLLYLLVALFFFLSYGIQRVSTPLLPRFLHPSDSP